MPSPDQRSRRRLIGAGVLGLAASLLPQIASRAAASTPDTMPDSSDGATAPAGATTTLASPSRPTVDDTALLGFAQVMEFTAVGLYETAIRGGGLGDSASLFLTLREAHLAYAQSLGALLGTSEPSAPLADADLPFAQGFGGSLDEVLASAYELEATAMATHSELVGALLGTDGAALVASILIGEARHCTVLAHLAGETDLDTLLLSDAAPLDPAKG